MKIFSKLFSILFGLTLLILVSCTPEEPVSGEEEIDTVKLTFANGPTATWELNGATPEIVLNANTTYATVTIEFTNAENNEDVTAEILEEAEDHLVCYSSSISDLIVSLNDKDANNLDLGLNTSWETGDTASGIVTVELRHQPAVKDGTCTPGDSDVEVVFDVTIQ